MNQRKSLWFIIIVLFLTIPAFAQWSEPAPMFFKDLAQVKCIAFAPNCKFNAEMFVIGKNQFDSPDKLLRIDPDGHAIEFGSKCSDIAFNQDGSMYVSEFSENENKIIISRIRNINY